MLVCFYLPGRSIQTLAVWICCCAFFALIPTPMSHETEAAPPHVAGQRTERILEWGTHWSPLEADWLKNKHNYNPVMWKACGTAYVVTLFYIHKVRVLNSKSWGSYLIIPVKYSWKGDQEGTSQAHIWYRALFWSLLSGSRCMPVLWDRTKSTSFSQ